MTISYFFTCSHVGDLGNLVTDEKGVINAVIEDHLVSLAGPYTVFGRAFVVRLQVDTYADILRARHAI